MSKIRVTHDDSFVVENLICMDGLINIGLFASGVGLTPVFRVVFRLGGLVLGP